jgi:hypothetical protein
MRAIAAGSQTQRTRSGFPSRGVGLVGSANWSWWAGNQVLKGDVTPWTGSRQERREARRKRLEAPGSVTSAAATTCSGELDRDMSPFAALRNDSQTLLSETDGLSASHTSTPFR